MTPEQMRTLRNELVDVLIEHWDRVLASSTDSKQADSLILTLARDLDDDVLDGIETYLRIRLEEHVEP